MPKSGLGKARRDRQEQPESGWRNYFMSWKLYPSLHSDKRIFLRLPEPVLHFVARRKI
jgi:hypothetical protein